MRYGDKVPKCFNGGFGSPLPERAGLRDIVTPVVALDARINGLRMNPVAAATFHLTLMGCMRVRLNLGCQFGNIRIQPVAACTYCRFDSNRGRRFDVACRARQARVRMGHTKRLDVVRQRRCRDKMERQNDGQQHRCPS